jgi:hypothetical protein
MTLYVLSYIRNILWQFDLNRKMCYTEILSNSSEQLKRRNFRMGMLNDNRCVSLFIYIKIDVIFIYRLINDIFQHLSMNQYSILVAIRVVSFVIV